MTFSNEDLMVLNNARSILKSASFNKRMDIMNNNDDARMPDDHKALARKEESMINDALESMKTLVLYAQELYK